MEASPFLKFRIKADYKSGLYFTVFIWRTKKDMRQHCFWMTRRSMLKCEGLCSAHTVYKFCTKTQRTSPDLGEIHLLKKFLYMEHVTHECCHAAFAYCRRKSIDPLKDITEEEKFCYSQGHMATQIARKLQKEKLWG